MACESSANSVSETRGAQTIRVYVLIGRGRTVSVTRTRDTSVGLGVVSVGRVGESEEIDNFGSALIAAPTHKRPSMRNPARVGKAPSIGPVELEGPRAGTGLLRAPATTVRVPQLY